MFPTAQSSDADARKLDRESAAWLARLQPENPGYPAAVEDLRMLLLKAARFETRRRAAAFAHTSDGELEDLAQHSADDALLAVLRKLGDFRGESRFTTWAYKFALLEAGVKLRRRAWKEREVQLDADGWSAIADRMQAPHEDVERRELIEALRETISAELTAHQRAVLVAVTLNDVPIDVLAEQLHTTRGALYKTVHDARRKLRATLAARGLDVDRELQERTR